MAVIVLFLCAITWCYCCCQERMVEYCGRIGKAQANVMSEHEFSRQQFILTCYHTSCCSIPLLFMSINILCTAICSPSLSSSLSQQQHDCMTEHVRLLLQRFSTGGHIIFPGLQRFSRRSFRENGLMFRDCEVSWGKEQPIEWCVLGSLRTHRPEDCCFERKSAHDFSCITTSWRTGQLNRFFGEKTREMMRQSKERKKNKRTRKSLQNGNLCEKQRIASSSFTSSSFFLVAARVLKENERTGFRTSFHILSSLLWMEQTDRSNRS